MSIKQFSHFKKWFYLDTSQKFSNTPLSILRVIGIKKISNIADLLYTEKEYEKAFLYEYITQMSSGGENYNSHVNLLNCLLQIKDKFFVLDHVKDVISYLIQYTNDERITYLIEALKQSGKTHLVIQSFRALSIVIHGHNFQTYISQLEQIAD